MGIFSDNDGNGYDEDRPQIAQRPMVKAVLSYREIGFLEQATLNAMSAGTNGLSAIEYAIAALEGLDIYYEKLKVIKAPEGKLS